MIRPEEGVWKIVHSARRLGNDVPVSRMVDTEIELPLAELPLADLPLAELPLAELPLAIFWEFLPSAARRIRTTGQLPTYSPLQKQALP
jgi:hypothetical protein